MVASISAGACRVGPRFRPLGGASLRTPATGLLALAIALFSLAPFWTAGAGAAETLLRELHIGDWAEYTLSSDNDAFEMNGAVFRAEVLTNSPEKASFRFSATGADLPQEAANGLVIEINPSDLKDRIALYPYGQEEEAFVLGLGKGETYDETLTIDGTPVP